MLGVALEWYLRQVLKFVEAQFVRAKGRAIVHDLELRT